MFPNDGFDTLGDKVNLYSLLLPCINVDSLFTLISWVLNKILTTIPEVQMKRIILPALLALNCASAFAYNNISQQQAELRAAQIGEVNYTLSIKLDKGSPSFDGVNVATFELKDNSRDVVFDFDGKLVRSVTINGEKTADFNFDIKQESIILPKRYLTKGENTVSIDYVGNFTHNGAGLHQFVDPADGNEYYYTDFEPADAHRFFPHFDQPSFKATYTIDVNAPVEWRLISNMPVAKSSEDETRKHSYFQTSKKNVFIGKCLL